MDLALRPMSTSQVLDRTFSLYRQNFILFAGIAALAPACLLLIRFLTLSIGRASTNGMAGMIAAGVAAGLAMIALFILWLIGYVLSYGATVYAVSRFHLGHGTSIREAYGLIRPYAGRLVGIVILAFLAVVAVTLVALIAGAALVFATGGFKGGPSGGVILILVLLVVATILADLYVSAKFALSVPACVIENLGVTDSMRRSSQLAQGSILRLVLVNFLAAIISLVLSMVLSVPYFIGVALMVTKKDPAALVPFLMLQYVAEFLASSLAFPIATIAVSLIYYDERVRKEAFDLQLMMQTLGYAEPAQAATGAAPGIG